MFDFCDCCNQCAACSCNNNCNNNSSANGIVVSVAAKRLLLIDATIVVQNAVASASVASSPTPVFAHAPISALSGVDVAAAGL